MRKKNRIALCFLIAALPIFAESSELFLYVPTDDEMGRFMGMHQFLREWDENKREVDAKALDALYSANIGKNTLNGLQFEAFLRNTKNADVRKDILGNLDAHALTDPFSACQRKLYAAKELPRESGGTAARRYSYQDEEFDEDIDLFDFYETGFFDQKLGLLLFDNGWEQVSLNGGTPAKPEAPVASDSSAGDTKSPDAPATSIESFYLIYGGGTSTMTVYCKKYARLPEGKIGETLAAEPFPAKYEGWKAFGLDAKGILATSGASKYVVAYGVGPDTIPGIDSGAFNAYLYDEKSETLYEVSASINFSPMNINYPTRARIYNYVLFTTREQREEIVRRSLSSGGDGCEGCSGCGTSDPCELYQSYIDGKKEIAEITREFNAKYVHGR